MKPRNFPGRREERRRRARCRASEPFEHRYTGRRGARASAHPTVKDTRWRLGAANRDPETGEGR